MGSLCCPMMVIMKFVPLLEINVWTAEGCVSTVVWLMPKRVEL